MSKEEKIPESSAKKNSDSPIGNVQRQVSIMETASSQEKGGVHHKILKDKLQERTEKIDSEKFYHSLLKNNRAWAEKINKEHPTYFKTLARIQTPQVLWIGCSDSRAPPEDITGTLPGDIFVQRNVSNLIVPGDMNLMSVLQYGLEQLKIETIIVCGHYGCGGVRHALSHNHSGLIDKWLKPIKDIVSKYRDELDAITDPEAKEKRVVELNVQEAVYRLCTLDLVQNAWKRNGATWADRGKPWVKPRIHGWVYDISIGLVREVPVDLTKLHEIYRFDLE